MKLPPPTADMSYLENLPGSLVHSQQVFSFNIIIIQYNQF